MGVARVFALLFGPSPRTSLAIGTGSTRWKSCSRSVTLHIHRHCPLTVTLGETSSGPDASYLSAVSVAIVGILQWLLSFRIIVLALFAQKCMLFLAVLARNRTFWW